MKDSKIYNVLTYFDKIEQNRLRKYIRSPYFNVNETLMDYFDILINHINKNGKGGELTKEHIWKQIFPQESFNDVRFRKLGSDLLGLFEDYLSQQQYDDSSFQKVSNLLEAINIKKLDRLYNSSIKKYELQRDHQYHKNADFYFYQFDIQKKLYNIRQADINRYEKSNVEEIINNLDYFYLAEKLKWYSAVLSRKSLISHEYKILFIDEIITHIENERYEDLPLIQIYHSIYMTQTERYDEEVYFKLKKLLHKNWQILSLNEAEEAYTHLISFCARKVNQGQNEFATEMLEIISEVLPKGIMYSTTVLNPWIFRNTVTAALRIKEYIWAEKFIHDYKDSLSVDLRENAVSYNLAQVYFYQKKYDKVKELLREVEYSDLIYNLSSKTILIAVYFELDEDEALESLMDSFKMFLSRHKEISPTQRVLYINLMKYVKKLRRVVPGNQKEIDKIKEEIEEDKKEGIASMKWLLEKLAELE